MYRSGVIIILNRGAQPKCIYIKNQLPSQTCYKVSFLCTIDITEKLRLSNSDTQFLATK
eukprot:COSAG01_NODE_5117_length_4473_cov_3.874714_8_plen_59_part_00